jgi:GNAT superfamily N-acetyltransferase
MTAVIYGIDRARPADRAALERLFAACSLTTIQRRFFAPLPRFPAAYLAGALAGPPHRHDAAVVRYGDGLHIAGLASLVALPGAAPHAAELGVLVADEWQGRGVGTALVEWLLVRAADRGVEFLTASVLPHRAGLLSALARRIVVLDVRADADCLTGMYRIPEEVGRGDDRTRIP